MPFDTSETEILFGWPKPEFVRSARILKWLQLFAAGTEIVDFDDVTRRGILVTNARGVASPNIAEHVLAMMLHFNRRLNVLVRAQFEKTWITKNSFDFPELRGQVLAVLGPGSIGGELAKRAACLGMQVLGISRSGKPVDGFVRVVALAGRDEILQQADHLAICVPGVDATAHMIDESWFAQMKPGACIYNVGRGSTVDETALLRAIESGRIAGAGLDVTGVEPLPADHPFWSHPNVLLTQHKAMNSRHYWERMTELFANNLDRFLNGKPLLNLVNAVTRY